MTVGVLDKSKKTSFLVDIFENSETSHRKRLGHDRAIS